MMRPLAQRNWRQAVATRNLDYFRWRFVDNARRTLLARTLPRVNREGCIPAALRADGVAVGPAGEFLSPNGENALVDASTAVLALSREPWVQAMIGRGASDQAKEYQIRLCGGEYAADSPLLKVALDVRLLRSVAAYLGMCPRLYSVDAYLNFPTGAEPRSAQLWHRDPEDLQVVKGFVYLVDVDDTCGPFCYVAGTQPLGRAAATVPRHEDRIRVTDAEMTAAFPRESWRICTGPAHTMILADTLGYHRGGRTTTAPRILITFTFTSGRPFKPSDMQISGTPGWFIDRIQAEAI